MSFTVQRLKDGQEFHFDDPTAVEQLVKSGQGILTSPVSVFNPKDEQTYQFDDPIHSTEAIKAGGVLEGSHAHTVAKTGKLESFGRSALQGLTGGFADEIAGGIEHLATGKPYSQARDESRINFKTAEEANPVTSTLGNLAGGVASFAVPGLGAVGKGLSGAIQTGAKLGGIYGLGNSEADLTKGQVGDAATDALKGAGVGAVLGGASDIAGKGLSFVGSKVAQTTGDAFNPWLQRALALGAKAKDLKRGDPLRERLQRAVPVLDEMGLFAKGADGKLPNEMDFVKRVDAYRQRTTDGMRDAVNKAGGLQLDLGDAVHGVQSSTAEIIANAPRGERDLLQSKLDDVLNDMADTGGDVAKMLQVKRNAGGWAQWDSRKSTDENNLYKAINGALDDHVTGAVDAAVQKSGGTEAQTLSKLNQQYAAISTAEKLLVDKVAQGQASSGLFGVKDAISASVGGAVGSMVGGPVGGALGYGAAALGGAAIKSTEGRLLRAQVGQALQQKAAQAQQAAAQGAIPRTVAGVQQWVAKNMQYISQSAPQLASIAQRLLKEPPDVAEQTVRTMMPLLTQMMTPSIYPSEFEGRALEPQDRLTISKQLQTTPGLTPSQLAARKSALNATGAIPGEVYVATQENPSIDDQMNAFAARIQAMGN